ncbi:Aspartate 1-decarboxylase precursor [Planctomycetes bacterium Poly30]|uniref:Aspartate 1-decarboxylase n=1 Tax=Saltatorellus ferox TaxID=2528018 RepID=A0A518ES18_9BACT|nr:Aspartate 1-decarboxylase precursor [Planctomycetes bacterium Poly30]
MRQFLRAKIHRATVTEANLEYIGSVTIDSELMERVDIAPYERVLIVDNTNGSRLETYAIPGPAGSGVVCINGAAAHLVREGDQVILMAFGYGDQPEAPKQILVDDENRFVREIETHERGVIGAASAAR